MGLIRLIGLIGRFQIMPLSASSRAICCCISRALSAATAAKSLPREVQKQSAPSSTSITSIIRTCGAPFSAARSCIAYFLRFLMFFVFF